FFVTDTSTSEIYTLSLHDALPILAEGPHGHDVARVSGVVLQLPPEHGHVRVHGPAHDILGVSPYFAQQLQPADDAAAGWSCCAKDRKSTRLNSSHVEISYAVFCLK